MANNPYVNKVQKADGTTIIDISDTTAAASDVASGKYFYTASGEKVEGSASGGGAAAITIDDAPDAGGGTVRTITAVDISSDTVTAAHLETGYTAHDADGNAITGQLSPSSAPTLQTKTNISPSESSQTITADTGYDGLDSVQINAIPSSYVGSGVTQRSSSDLSASGATVTVPAGYYASAATKSVASGTAGTPSASKGAVSNHSVAITPSVTNTTGYITGSTKTGTAVTVSASELVSGSETKTANGTYDVTNLAELVVNVSGGSSKAIYMYEGLATRTANSYGSTSATVTVTKAGTYNISYIAVRGSSSGTMGTNLHIGNTAGTNNQTFTHGTYGQYAVLTNQQIAANTAVTIYATSGSTTRSIYVGQLIVQEV